MLEAVPAGASLADAQATLAAVLGQRQHAVRQGALLRQLRKSAALAATSTRAEVGTPGCLTVSDAALRPRSQCAAGGVMSPGMMAASAACIGWVSVDENGCTWRGMGANIGRLRAGHVQAGGHLRGALLPALPHPHRHEDVCRVPKRRAGTKSIPATLTLLRIILADTLQTAWKVLTKCPGLVK